VAGSEVIRIDNEWRRADLTRNSECTGKDCESYAGFCLNYYVTAAWFDLMTVMTRSVQSAIDSQNTATL
jgi:hypothetical protein